MTLRLILIRHAKSSWDAPVAGDHARPLSDRGVRAADAIGAWLAAEAHVPDAVLSSDAQRTRETWAHLAPHLPGAPPVQWTPTLYLAGPGTMFQALKGMGEVPVALMLGHNPGIAQLAEAIVAEPPSHPRFRAYPTGACLVADFSVAEWAEIQPAAGTVVDFIVPRDLTG